MATFCRLSCSGYPAGQGKKAKKKLTAPNISLTLDRSEGSLLSDELDESTELDLDGIDTPSDNSNEFEWEGEKCPSFQFSRDGGFKKSIFSSVSEMPAPVFLLLDSFARPPVFLWCCCGGRVLPL